MTRLILHVGTPKTATTSLQMFLKENRTQLNENGVDYPIFSNGSPNNGKIWTLSIHDDREISDKDLYILKNSIRRYDTVILSNEGFWGAKRKDENKSFEEKEILYWQTCKDYFKKYGIDQIEIVVYIRRQDYYLSSGWKQWIKVGYSSGNIDQITKADYFEKTSDYLARLECLEKVFGKHKIYVSLFGENSFVGGDIFHDFLHQCQIEWKELYTIPRKMENVSLTYDVTEAMRRFISKYGFDRQFFHSFLYFMAFRLSAAHPEKRGLNLFDYSQQVSLHEKYQEGNEKIAQRYFGRNQLFSKSKEEDLVWKPNEEQIKKYYSIFVIQYRLWRIPFVRTSILLVRKAMNK